VAFINFEVDALRAKKMAHTAPKFESGVKDFGAKILADNKSAQTRFVTLVEAVPVAIAPMRLGKNKEFFAYLRSLLGRGDTLNPPVHGVSSRSQTQTRLADRAARTLRLNPNGVKREARWVVSQFEIRGR
jgi:hypothetical protein